MADDEVQAYYARGEEADRLARGVGRVEHLRTIEVVSRVLPPRGATVADVGGGPGRYTDWLVEAGYRVVHRDLVARHVEDVRARHGPAVDAAVVDARALDLADGSVDVVLLLGPLYHLPTREDRVATLAEAARVVRPGGPVCAAAISRWAPRLHGVLSDRVHHRYPVLLDRVDEMERTGWMPPLHEGGFSGATHTPDELASEVEEAGLHLSSLVALEGITCAVPDLDARLDDPAEREVVLDALRALESVPELLGLGPHLLATARRPA